MTLTARGLAVASLALLCILSFVHFSVPAIHGRHLAEEDSLPADLRHKDLFPLNGDDILGTILAVAGLIIAASGGIGGGGILVPLLILIFKFSPKMAIPLSTFTILGSSVTNMVLNLSKRHPEVDRPLVDWDLIMVMEPLTAAGAIVGSFLSKVLPDWFLTISLVCLLALTSHRTLKKGIQQYKQETLAHEKERSALSEAAEKEIEMEGLEESSRLLGEEALEDPAFEKENTELRDLLTLERDTPRDKVMLMIIMFVVIVFINLIKGGGKSFPSPIGIVCGSFTYWSMTGLIILWVLAISLYARQELVKKYHLKKRLRYKYIKGDVEWNERNTIIYPCLCIFAGFCAGMFGVGGGVVKGPLMLEMGVHPMVAAATVAVMIFFTSIAATTSYIAFGTLKFDYGYYLFCFGLVATAVGQIGVGHLVKKYKRNSLISLSIGAVVALSTCLMGLQSVLSLMSEESEDSSSALCT